MALRLFLFGTLKFLTRTTLWAINLVAVCALLTVAAGAYVLWRVHQEPQSLDSITPWLVEQVNSSTSGFDVAVGGGELTLTDEGLYSVRLRDVVLRQRDTGAVAITVPSADVGFSLSDLVRGNITVSTFDLIGASIRFVREENGEYAIGISGNSISVSELMRWTVRGSVDSAQMGIEATQASRLRIGLRHALLTFDDRLLSRTLNGYIDQAWLNTRRTDAGDSEIVDGTAKVVLGTGAGSIALDLGVTPTENGLVLSADHDDATIAQISNLVGAQAPEELEDIRIKSQARYVINGDGTLPTYAFRASSSGSDLVFLQEQFPQLKLRSAVLEASGDDFDVITINRFTLETNYGQISSSGRFSTLDSAADPSVVTKQGRVEEIQELVGKLTFRPRNEQGVLQAVEDELVLNVALGSKVPENQDNSTEPEIVADLDKPIADEDSVVEVESKIDTLVIRAISWRKNQGNWTVVGEVGIDESDRYVRLNGSVSNFALADLYRPWPDSVIPRTRAWMVSNIHSGIITNGTLRLRLPHSVISGEQAIADNHLSLDFSYQDLELTYLNGMPSIENANGSASLSGEKFVTSAQSAYIALNADQRMQMHDVLFEASPLIAERNFGSLRSSASGDLTTILKIINLPPLGLLEDSRLGPEQLGGDVSMQLDLHFPMEQDARAEEVTTNVTASISSARVDKVFSDYNLRDGSFDVSINPFGITALGEGSVEGIDMSISWQSPFDRVGSSKVEEYRIKTTVNDEERERLGMSLLPGAITGSIYVDIEATVKNYGLSRQVIRFDATDARLKIEPLLFHKPIGSAASGVAVLRRTNDTLFAIQNFSINGDDFSVSAQGEFNFAEAIISRLRIDDARWRGNHLRGEIIRRSGGTFDAFMTGSYVDVRPFMADLGIGEELLKIEDKNLAEMVAARVEEDKAFGQNSLNGDTNDSVSPTWRIFLTLDEVLGYDGVLMNSVTGGLRFANGSLHDATMRGSFPDGKGVGVVLKPASNGNSRQRMVVSSDGGGWVMRGLGFYDRLSGGDLSLDLLLHEENNEVLDGTLQVNDFEIVGEQLLSELMKQNPQPGQPATSETVRFSELVVPFSIDKQIARIDGMRMNNQSVGVTMHGEISRKDDKLNLGGTFTPLYAINTFIGQIPLFGDILTGGKDGEGMFGIVFAVGGTIDSPSLIVNPMSALTPGVIRRIFDGALPTDIETDGR